MDDSQYHTLIRRMEFLADCIMTEKRQRIELDKKRNLNRESLNYIKRSSKDEKLMFLSGSLFLKLPSHQIKDIIEKEQKYIDEETKRIDESIKEYTKELLILEGKYEEFKGFDLKPVNLDDLSIDDMKKL